MTQQTGFPPDSSRNGAPRSDRPGATPPPSGESGRPWRGDAAGPAGPGPGVNSPWVSGGVMFAGVLMLLNGVLAVLQGIAAIAEDEQFEVVDGYVYRINLTGWGWILLILGVLLIAVGSGLLSRAAWARYTGIALAGLAAVAQFLFLPYQPIWSILMIAMNVFIIWALASYRPDAADA